MNRFSHAIAGVDCRRGRTPAPPDAVRRALLAACEAEMNLGLHSRGGRMDARLAPGRVDVEVSDVGPGIPDVGRRARRASGGAARAEVPRRSRGGLDAAARALGLGAGMGLANIRRASDAFAIDSVPGRGTRVRFTVYLKGADTAAAGGAASAGMDPPKGKRQRHGR